MAINPYTLNHLYMNGILEYVPTELMMPSPMGIMSTNTNNYMNLAKQGALYQNHGAITDSFHSSFTPAYTPNNYQSVSTGANYGASLGRYAGSSYTHNGYGFYGNNTAIGSRSNTGGANAFGGFPDVQNAVSNGFNKTMSIVNNTPKLILGIAAGIIGITGVAMAFKRGKKP